MENEVQETRQPYRTPVGGFLHHQWRAIEETGKAFASLLPHKFRRHVDSAIKETRASYVVLFDGVIDTVQDGLGSLRSEKKDEPVDKVKVEVEGE